MLIPKNHYTFNIEVYVEEDTDYENVFYIILASPVNLIGATPTTFETMHTSLEDAEKELRGLKVYLRQNYSHVDTEANYSKIV